MTDRPGDKVAPSLELPPWVGCPYCGRVLPIDLSVTADYFNGTPVRCTSCSKDLDWWETILDAIRGDFMLQAFTPVGARWTFFTILLQAGKPYELRLADHGVPADAKILQVMYTPQGGGLFPLEMHGNAPLRHEIPNVLYLYPRPFGDGPHEDTKVAVLVVWVPDAPTFYAWQNLLLAFEAHVARRYSSVVIPGNVAVESTLGALMYEYFERYASKERVRAFLEDHGTYAHQLNVLLPTLASLSKAPVLPGRIAGLLNRLRKLRHQMAHRGALDTQIGREEAAELLCAALFGFHYLNLFRPTLLGLSEGGGETG